LVVVKGYSKVTKRGETTFFSGVKPVLFHIALRVYNGEDITSVLASVDKQFADWKAAGLLNTVLGWVEPGTKCKNAGVKKPFEIAPALWPKHPINAAMLTKWEVDKKALLANPKAPRKGKGK
jgi:hypothetical protein